jgi:hypothetical protein
MNLGNIRGTIYDRLGYYQNPDSAIVRRLDRMINDSHREIVTRKSMGRLRRAVLTFPSTSGNPLAVLPQAAVMVLAIADRSTNRILDEITLQDTRARDPGLKFTSSIPDAYTIINLSSAVAQDPAAALQLFVVSDNAADGAGISANIEGIVTGGYYRRARTALNGVTAVAMDTSTAWIHITKFYLSGQATGNVTLTDGGANTYAQIVPGRSRARYTQIHLSGVPASAGTYYADVELHIDDMANPSDEPYTPEDFDWLLIAGALRLEYLRRGGPAMQQWKVEEKRWTDGVKDCQSFVTRTSGVARGSRKTQFSHLGPFFPADKGFGG